MLKTEEKLKFSIDLFFFYKRFLKMCYNFCKLSLVDRPKERLGEAIDCALGSNTLLGWAT